MIAEILWKLFTLAAVTLFCVALPFLVTAACIWHPHMTPLDEDGFWFFKAMATLFGGVAVAIWWLFFKILYVSFTGRKIGAWSTVLVFFGTYALEFLLLSQGVYTLR
jgi:hypothetical protein